jgi:transcriptional regulator with XRE-family HTH domain
VHCQLTRVNGGDCQYCQCYSCAMPLHAKRLELGERLRISREGCRLSLMDVATDLGLSKQAVAAWEKGRTGISAIQLATLALSYGVSADYLLFGITAIPEELRQLLMKSKRTA